MANSLIDNGILREITCGANFAYVLAEGVKIQPTEYKVMQNQNVRCLVRCMRMKYNGKDELYYMTSWLKSFLSVFMSATPDAAANLVTALLKSIVELRSIGFLSCANIDGSLDKIFVDTNTNRVQVVYLPIDKHIYTDEMTFENELRSALIRRIDELPGNSAKLTKVRQSLMNSMISIESIAGGGVPDTSEAQSGPVNKPVPPQQRQRLIITAVNVPSPVQFVVDKDEFTIGKSAEADGQIAFNKYIGRKHCVIVRNVAGFSVIDLESKNGTFLNGVRLAARKIYDVRNGDTLRLANCDFRLSVQH